MLDRELPRNAELHDRLFRQDLPMQLTLREVRRLVVDTEGLHCLEIGGNNGMFSLQLRKMGGDWTTVVTHPDVQAPVQAFLGEEVVLLDESRELPYEAKQFDVVAICGGWRGGAADRALIEACHGVMKPSGRLVVAMPHSKPVGVVQPLRRIKAKRAEGLATLEVAYTEPELFSLLKCGFDVHVVRTYCRVFMSLVDVLTRHERRGEYVSEWTAAGADRAYRVASTLWRVAYQLDALVPARGYRMVATAKRHVWLPRSAPVLTDGRSISEAVLSRIGS